MQIATPSPSRQTGALVDEACLRLVDRTHVRWLLTVHPNPVTRDWNAARAWLDAELGHAKD